MAAALKGNGPHPPFCLSLRHPAFIRIFADVSKRGECEPGQTGHREEQLLKLPEARRQFYSKESGKMNLL